MGLAIVIALAAATPLLSAEIPAAQTEIATACQTSPTIGVKWESFGDDADGRAAFVKAGLGFLTNAFGDVCKDATLKAEVGKQIRKVVLAQAYGAADPIIYLSRGALYVEYMWAPNEGGPDAKMVRDEIAARLKGEEPEAP